MRLWVLVVVAVSCGYPDPSDVARLTGTVHGLWDGNDGLVLHVTGEHVDRTLAIAADGDFALPELLVAGTAYTVEVATDPTSHTCAVTHGAGMAGDQMLGVDVACTGPATMIALSVPAPWTFDPTLSTQSVPVSMLTQATTVTVTGAIDTVALDGTSLALGVASARRMLPTGPTTLAVAAHAGGLAKTYTIVIDRGAIEIAQSAYVKESNTHSDDNFACCTVNYAFDGNLIAIGAVSAANRNGAVYVFRRDGATWTQEAILTASNGEPEDFFGYAVAIVGGLIVVGAPHEASAATGIDPLNGQSDNSAPNAGAVYVFRRAADKSWSQQSYIKAATAGANDAFGSSVSLLGGVAGTAVLAVGASGVSGFQTFGLNAGSVRLFGFDLDQGSGVWRELATVQSPNAEPRGAFGLVCVLSGALADNTAELLVGAPGEDQFRNPILGTITSKGAAYAFAVRETFTTGGVQLATPLELQLKPAVAHSGDSFGVSISRTGSTAVVGAVGESSNGHGVDSGRESDLKAPGSGAAYVFERAGGTWELRHYVKASNAGGAFGFNVAIAGDLMAIGASYDNSRSTGVNQPVGGGTDSLAPSSGAVYVFARTSTSWTQIAYVKASNTATGALFGLGYVALSLDTLLVGASGESSDAVGINPPTGQNDMSAPSAGALYIFR